MLNYKKPMLWVTVLAAIAVLIVAVCLVSNSTPKLPVVEITDTSELTVRESAWYEENLRTMEATVLQTETGYLFLYRGQTDKYGYYTATAKLKGTTLQIDVKANDAVSEQYVSSTILARIEIEHNKVENVSMNFEGENTTLKIINDLELTPELTPIAQVDQSELLSEYVSDWPMLSATYETDYTQDDRQFRLEDSVDNEAEQLVYRFYFDEISANFVDYENIIGDNEALVISAHNTKKNYDEGIYIKSYTLHHLKTLSASEIVNQEDFYLEILKDDLNRYGITHYTIVEVDVSWIHNDASKKLGPQLDDGRYMRHFLIGCTDKTPNWRIYEIYWCDLLK